MKLKLFILITLVDFDEWLTDFSYTTFTVGLSNVDALERLRVHLSIILLHKKSMGALQHPCINSRRLQKV